jgi:nicotinamide/nicotinate riboside kinase
MWKDPPEYWEQIVYPAYVRAHADVFEGGDVENGQPTTNMKKLVLIEGMSMDIDSIVERACEAIEHFTEG